MHLKSISLKNIRSYSSLNLNFHEGSTLLSGDIGAGKTTILLSLEFALFGLMKGMLSGASLLRHGSKEGSVTLEFSINEKNYRIQRTLKRTSSGITQDSGYIETDGQRTDCTAVELKSRILSILGYPDELLTKSKSLIFRYTVYTPQEEMKGIIFDSEEDRLEKLTKIFNVEKYKRIRENAENYAKDLRSETKMISYLDKELSDLAERQKKYESEMEEKSIALQQLEALTIAEEKILKETESKIKSLEETAKYISTLNQEIKILAVEKTGLLRNLETAKNEIASLELQKKKISEELSAEKEENEHGKPEETNELLSKYRIMKEETESKIIDAKSKLGSIERKLEESAKLKEKIISLQTCPTCRQEVDNSHKEHIIKNEEEKIKEYEQKKVQLKALLDKAESNLKVISKKISALEEDIIKINKIEQKENLRKYKARQLTETDDKLIKTKNRISDIEKDLQFNSEMEKKIAEKITDTLFDENQSKELEKKFRECKNNHLSLKMKESAVIQSIKEITSNLERTETEKKNKKEQTDILLKKREIERWLSDHFVSLVEIIEKNVMGNIRAEFKEHFEDWFNMLIEDESISATLDEKFTPRISQNGYDTEIDNLSGGEKTSVALAYRLALNKVINSKISTIKTKNLIILDEPTDGFSSHQLDKVREVLEALHSKQTIIVSHESKMESFVDHIIKIRKHEHESEVLL